MENKNISSNSNFSANLAPRRVIKDQGYYRPVNKRMQFWQTSLLLFLSAMTYSVSFHYFVASCKFAPGGIGGIMAMIQHLLGATTSNEGLDLSSLIILFLNIPILIPAYKILSKQFAVRTFIIITLMTAWFITLDNFIDPTYKFSFTGKPIETDIGTRLISAIFGGACCGVSLALALKVNSSTGGADIIGAMLQKKNPHTSVANMIFLVNCVVMAASFFIYRDMLMPVFLSIIYIYMTSSVCDRLLQGSKTALKFEVVTDHGEDIAEEIINTLGHGVTIAPAKGMFEQKEKSLLICVIQPRQIAKFQAIISRYPDTFAYVGHVNEIIGKFRKK